MDSSVDILKSKGPLPQGKPSQPSFVANFVNGHMRRPNRSPAGAVLLALGLLYSSAVAGQTAGLFTPVDGGPSAIAPLPEGTLRSRLVKADHGRLGRVRAVAAALRSAQDRLESSRVEESEAAQASGASLRLNLFEDVSATAIVEWAEATFSGGYSLSGSLLGDSLGSMTLVVNGNRLVGSVQTGGRTYRIRSAGGGLSSIIEVEEPPFRCGVDDPSPEADHGPHQ